MLSVIDEFGNIADTLYNIPKAVLINTGDVYFIWRTTINIHGIFINMQRLTS